MAKTVTRSLGEDDEPKQEKTQPQRTNHLLLIAIDSYKNGIPPLNNAVRDALAFKKLMVEKFQFSEKNVVELLNEKATRGNIISAFDDCLRRLTDRDNLVIYYSGHGIFDKPSSNGYWIPVDAQNIRADFLHNIEVTNFIKNLKAFHILGIVDSCYSEALFKRSIGDQAAEKFENFPSRWLITAGRMEPVSDGSLGKNSPFATAILTYLQNSTQKMVWVSDMFNHIKRVVANNANQIPRGEPWPDVGDQGGEFIFRVKGYNAPSQKVEKRIETKEPTRGTTQPVEINISGGQIVGVFNDLDGWKMIFKEKIAESLDDALVFIKPVLNPSSRKFNDFVMLNGRFNNLKKNMNSGTVTDSQSEITTNQIRNALIDFVDGLKKEDIKSL